MPQLDVYMYPTLLITVFIFIVFLFIVSQIMVLSLTMQQYFLKYTLRGFDIAKPRAAYTFYFANLKSISFRETFVYLTAFRLVN